MSERYTVLPMRFSRRPQEMIGFLEALGLRKRLDTETGTYALFDGASGRVAVHGIEEGSRRTSGDTTLNFAVDDVQAVVQALADGGMQTAVWDETYAKQGIVRTADGRVIGLNENTQDDLYGGYRLHEQSVAASLDVVAVWYSDDFTADARYFAAFGFEPFGSLDDPWWCDLRTGRRTGGVIGLHGTGGGSDLDRAETPDEAPDELTPPALVRLGFETAEPLDALAARLAAAGYQAAVVENEAGPQVHVTDPDGQHLEIHPTV